MLEKNAHHDTETRLERLRELRPPAEHELLAKAEEWMKEVHEGDLYGDRPYTEHTTEVALRVAEWWPDAPVELIVAALLHDSLEDHPERLAKKAGTGDGRAALAAGFGGRVAELVAALSNPAWPMMAREDWLAAYRGHVVGLVEGKPDAGRVKLADLSTNALGLDSVPDEGKRKHYAEKYGPVLRALVELAGELPAEHPFAGDSEPRRLFTAALGAPPYA